MTFTAMAKRYNFYNADFWLCLSPVFGRKGRKRQEGLASWHCTFQRRFTCTAKVPKSKQEKTVKQRRGFSHKSSDEPHIAISFAGTLDLQQIAVNCISGTLRWPSREIGPLELAIAKVEPNNKQ